MKKNKDSVEFVEVSSAERNRIQEIIAAARTLDWEKFVTLTDLPFPNLDSMREQFDEAAPIVAAVSEPVTLQQISAITRDDGQRQISADIDTNGATRLPIVISLCSSDNGPNPTITITVFLKQFFW
ncbi:hypothetical protein [Rhizobium ecuadorense]|uniref:hypothetical protein n=1 Tax=Rhizobium ecuadorense TaxID=1671795 RepID=UPI0006732A4F|nr:hypothetical protein [Rhizobium ecuadorense]